MPYFREKLSIDMKNFRLTYLLLAFALVISACEGGASSENENAAENQPEVVKVEPQEQDFPVNKIPDDEFGKAAAWEDAAVEVPAEKNLSASDEKFPDWLDAIISRESIVLFAQRVLSEMPEEVEFVQSGQQHMTGPDGWKAFSVQFNTRPSNANLIIYGGYMNENDSWWASDYTKGSTSIDWTHISKSDNGVMLHGAGHYDGEENAYNFSADIGKKSVALKRAKAGA
jgi:hypothetical protein